MTRRLYESPPSIVDLEHRIRVLEDRVTKLAAALATAGVMVEPVVTAPAAADRRT